MYSEPCAKLTMRVTPKISVSPAATRNNADADARPFSSWIVSDASVTQKPRRSGARLFRRSNLANRVVVRQIVFAVRIGPIDHHAFAVLDGGASDECAHRRLVIDRAKSDPA